MTNREKIRRYVIKHAHCFNVRMTDDWMGTIRLGDNQQWHLAGSGKSNLKACEHLVKQIEKTGDLKKWVLAQKRR